MATPSPLSYLLGMADEALTVRELVGSQRLWAVPASQDAAEAALTMAQQGFDVAPVNSVPVERYVTRLDLEHLQGLVGEAAREIDPEHTLSEATPLALALESLALREYYFVRHRHHVTGVITRADIAKPVVSLFAFGLVLSLESALDRLIDPGDNGEFLEHLSPGRASGVQDVFDTRIAINSEISLVLCLNLDDRLKLAKKMRLHEPLGFPSAKQLGVWSEQIKPFRDSVAHGSGLLDAQPDPVAAIRFVLDLRRRCELVWEHVTRPMGDAR